MMGSWADYLSAHLAVAEIDEHYADQQLNHIKALNTIDNKDEKTMTLAKARLYENPDYITLLSIYDLAYSEKKIVQSLFNTAERRTNSCSRELSRRIGRNGHPK
jgi:hypothetical protein